MEVAHIAVYLSACSHSRDRVEDDDVDSTRADKGLRYLESLLAAVGLRHEEVVDIYAESLRVYGVEGVLYVDERRLAACLLSLRDDGQRNGRLTRALGTVYLDDTSARDTADTERHIEHHRARRYSGNVEGLGLTEAHDSARAVLLFYLLDSAVEGSLLVLRRICLDYGSLLCDFLFSHCFPPFFALSPCGLCRRGRA